MRFVEMFHPGTGGTAQVPTSAVPARHAKGWVLTEDVPDASSDVTTDEPHEEN